MYFDGYGVPLDHAEALKWLRKAADQGHAGAQNHIGNMYNEGLGVRQDYAEAVRWHRKAGDQGDAFAQFNLGTHYLLGKGIPQNDSEAVKWNRKSAEQGFAKAQVKLGALYASGRGVPQDYVIAHMWVNLGSASAALSGAEQKSAAIFSADIAAKMTAQQIAEAQRLARNWKPVNVEQGRSRTVPK